MSRPASEPSAFDGCSDRMMQERVVGPAKSNHPRLPSDTELSSLYSVAVCSGEGRGHGGEHD
jgi:hypothetical protein